MRAGLGCGGVLLAGTALLLAGIAARRSIARERILAAEDEVARVIAKERERRRALELPVWGGAPIDADAGPLYRAAIAGQESKPGESEPTRCRHCDLGFRFEDGVYPGPEVSGRLRAMAQAQLDSVHGFEASDDRPRAREACFVAARIGLDLSSDGPYLQYLSGMGLVDEAMAEVSRLVLGDPGLTTAALEDLETKVAALDAALPDMAASYERDRWFQLANLLRHGQLEGVGVDWVAPTTTERWRAAVLPSEILLADGLDALQDYYEGVRQALASPTPHAALATFAAECRHHRNRIVRTFAGFPGADASAVAKHRESLATLRALLWVERSRLHDGRYPATLEAIVAAPRPDGSVWTYEATRDGEGFRLESRSSDGTTGHAFER